MKPYIIKMKIPHNLSEQEVIDIITRIARRLAPKFVFASYDIEDIFQEAFIMGIDGLDKYDSSRPLANFMFTHISNRLKNFKRDNYFRLDIGTAQTIQVRKKNILEAIDIENMHSVSLSSTIPEDVSTNEILEIIDKQLPAEFRKDYLKLRTNAQLSKSRKAQLIEVIREIIRTHHPA